MRKHDTQDLYTGNCLGLGQTITGDLELSAETHIYGRIIGDITMIKDERIRLLDNSELKGNVNCYDIDIVGSFVGNLKSKGTVTIKSSAVVSGTIECARIIIYPGSIVNAQRIMSES